MNPCAPRPRVWHRIVRRWRPPQRGHHHPHVHAHHHAIAAATGCPPPAAARAAGGVARALKAALIGAAMIGTGVTAGAASAAYGVPAPWDHWGVEPPIWVAPLGDYRGGGGIPDGRGPLVTRQPPPSTKAISEPANITTLGVAIAALWFVRRRRAR